MNGLLRAASPAIDRAIAPVVYAAGRLLRAVRGRILHLPASKRALIRAGVFPILDHYYEPLFNPARLRHPLDRDRSLPGIAWNVGPQLALLDQLEFAAELATLESNESSAPHVFNLQNGLFEWADADFWYSMVRRFKPARIVEVGSGHSTLVARMAIRRNQRDDPGYTCVHTCIEPYEMPWLEEAGVQVIRERVENIPLESFLQLRSHDILFIDSSHVVRPQGDVVAEFLQILPILERGVIVHVHDIFTPKDYPREWVEDRVHLWSEQYLLEGFLTHNASWEVLAALNYLHHHHFDALKAVCPHLAPALAPDWEPHSFYMRRV